MLMRGLLAAAALAVGVAASAALMLDLGNAGRRLGMLDPEDSRDTLSLAPSAAATLRTRWSEESQDGVPDALPPSFQYVLRVGHGDTLGGLLIDAGVPGTEAEAAIRVLAKHYNPRRIRNGQEITVIFEPPARGSIDAGLPTPGRFLGLTIEPEYDIAVEVVRAASPTPSALNTPWSTSSERFASAATTNW